MPKLNKHKIKNVIHKSTPAHLIRAQHTKQVIRRFADELGMVYFGYVNPKLDEYRLVRGLTVSKSHDDHHYTVGTFKGYDISIVVRRDSLTYPDARITDHFWTIMTFDLHTRHELPHVYIAHKARRDFLAAKYTDLGEQPADLYAGHTTDARNEYTIFGSNSKAIEVAALVQPAMLDYMAKQFRGMSVEIEDNTVYLYMSTKHPSRQHLEFMMRNGIWLAQSFDELAWQIYDQAEGMT